MYCKISLKLSTIYELQGIFQTIHWLFVTVYFFNYPWPDFNVGSLSFVLDAVKVMAQAMKEGKVAVHCHAGRGK